MHPLAQHLTKPLPLLTKPFTLLFRHRRLLFIPIVLVLSSIALHTYQNHIPRPPHRLDAPFYTGCQDTTHFAAQPRENATISMLARNSDRQGAVESIISLEENFNSWAKYPYTFLNDEAWEDEFMDAVKEVASGEVHFGVIDQDVWSFPPHLNTTAAATSMTAQGASSILYGNVTSYHHMCRFNSGPFALHPLLLPYTYYWRLEPHVRFTCRITYDPFAAMRAHGKKYGYIMALWEIPATVPSLYRAVADFKDLHKIPTGVLWRAFSSRPWWWMRVLGWLGWGGADGYTSAGGGERWNLCHFWSNFEIASLEFFRSERYRELFEYLDGRGGFYYERWGDAPVHSLAAALLLGAGEVHHFADFGYKHAPWQYCPFEVRGREGVAVDLSRVPEEEARGLGCDCVCDGTAVVRPVCLNRIKETVL